MVIAVTGVLMVSSKTIEGVTMMAESSEKILIMNSLSHHRGDHLDEIQ